MAEVWPDAAERIRSRVESLQATPERLVLHDRSPDTPTHRPPAANVPPRRIEPRLVAMPPPGPSEELHLDCTVSEVIAAIETIAQDVVSDKRVDRLVPPAGSLVAAAGMAPKTTTYAVDWPTFKEIENGRYTVIFRGSITMTEARSGGLIDAVYGPPESIRPVPAAIVLQVQTGHRGGTHVWGSAEDDFSGDLRGALRLLSARCQRVCREPAPSGAAKLIVDMEDAVIERNGGPLAPSSAPAAGKSKRRGGRRSDFDEIAKSNYVSVLRNADEAGTTYEKYCAAHPDELPPLGEGRSHPVRSTVMGWERRLVERKRLLPRD